jgi:hypothetical protein
LVVVGEGEGEGLFAGTEGEPEASPEQAKHAPRPEWVPEKFWDDEQGQVKSEQAVRSYNELWGLTSKKWNGLSEADQISILNHAPKEMVERFEADIKGRLSGDQEFRQSLLPKAPEAYELKPGLLPEGSEISSEDPLFASAANVLKKIGAPQEIMDELVQGYVEAIKQASEAQRASREEKVKQLGDNLAGRKKTIETKLEQVLKGRTLEESRANVKALMDSLTEPMQFIAIEKLVQAGQSGWNSDPVVLGVSGGEKMLTEEELQALIGSEAYQNERHPEHKVTQEKVTRGYQKLYPGAA